MVLVNKNLIFCTHSNLNALNKGDSNNDTKLLNAIPKLFSVKKIFPIKHKIKLYSISKLIKDIFIESIKRQQIFLIRQPRLGIIQSVLKPIFKHKIILYFGCTIHYLEKAAFLKNPNFQKRFFHFKKFILKIDSVIQNFVLNKASLHIVENKRVKEIIKKNGVESSKIILAPYYVQDYFLKNDNIKFDINSKDPFIIGYTGRFEKYDDLKTLIEAIYLLKKKNYYIKLWLIGDGTTRNEISRFTKNMKLEQDVYFFGIQPHKNVAELMKNMHCLVLPMVKYLCPSTIAIKILEAILMGKIVITNNSGNNKSLFKPNEQVVINKNLTPQLLTYYIIEVMKNYSDYVKIFKEIKTYQLRFHNKKNFIRNIKKGFQKL